MLNRIATVLVTPVGIRLSSPTRFGLLMGFAGSAEYAYGDRENGGVFKHAAMMAAVALTEAARRVEDGAVAERAAGLALDVLKATAPVLVQEREALGDGYALVQLCELCAASLAVDRCGHRVSLPDS